MSRTCSRTVREGLVLRAVGKAPAELSTGRLEARQPCPLVSKKAEAGSLALISPPALSISAWLPASGSSYLHDPRQGSTTPDLLLWLRTLSKASFSPQGQIPVLSAGPLFPHQLGLVRRGPLWQAGRAVSAGAPGASLCRAESRGRAGLGSSHICLPGGEWRILFTQPDKLLWHERKRSFWGESGLNHPPGEVRGFQPQMVSSLSWFREGAVASFLWQIHLPGTNACISFPGHRGQV